MNSEIQKPVLKAGEATTPVPTNLHRRRLVRGAAAAAPLVLTLRSGAVAAASCVGAKALDATVNAGGKITLNGGTAEAGDVCVTNVTVCPDPNQPTKVIAGTPDTLEISGSGTNLFCGNARNTTQVAILSSTSVTSLTNLTG